MDKYLLVGLGGFLGAMARYGLGLWAAQKWGASFPYGTLLINVSGSFALGLFLAASAGRVPLDPRYRLFFAIGFVGAYTTFSTFTVEAVQLLLTGAWGQGLAYLLASNLLGVAGAVAGVAAGRVL